MSTSFIVENNGDDIINGKVYPDWRVTQYVDGEFFQQWDGGWSEAKANKMLPIIKANPDMDNEHLSLHVDGFSEGALPCDA